MKLISAFVFATWIVQSLYFLNPKFQASSHLVWLYSPVCVGPGHIPGRPVFSQRGSFWHASCHKLRAKGYKTFSCSILLSMKFILLINVKIRDVSPDFRKHYVLKSGSIFCIRRFKYIYQKCLKRYNYTPGIQSM